MIKIEDAEVVGVRDPLLRIGAIGAINTDIGQETARNEEIAVGVVIGAVTEEKEAAAATDVVTRTAAPHMSRAARGRVVDTEEEGAVAHPVTAGLLLTVIVEAIAETNAAEHRTHQRQATKEEEIEVEQEEVDPLMIAVNTIERIIGAQFQVHPVVRVAPPDHPLGAEKINDGVVVILQLTVKMVATILQDPKTMVSLIM